MCAFSDYDQRAFVTCMHVRLSTALEREKPSPDVAALPKALQKHKRVLKSTGKHLNCTKIPKTQLTRARSFTSLSRSPHRLVPHITFPTSLAPPPFTTTYISTFHRLHSPHSLLHLSILFTCPLPLITSPPTQLLWVQGITRPPLRRTARTLRLYARMATLASAREHR